jgi:hypothetical protein
MLLMVTTGIRAASGNEASVTRGVGNTAGASATTVIGGHNVTSEIGGSIRPQPPFTL